MNLLNTSKAALINFNENDGWAMASHIALSMIMALFPFVIFATSMAAFFGFEDQTSNIVSLVFETWPDNISKPIVNEIDAVLTDQNAGFLSTAVVLALFFASNGVEAVRVGLDRAYDESNERSFLYCRLQSLIFVVCGALLLMGFSTLLVLRPVLHEAIVEQFPVLETLGTPIFVLRFTLSIGALLFAVYACHAWLPTGKRSFNDLWPGIALTLTLWIISATAFSHYLDHYSNYGATFAGLASIMIALVFLYLMAVILLLGGEFNAALRSSRS